MQEQRRNSASPSGGRDGHSGRAGEVPDRHGKDRDVPSLCCQAGDKSNEGKTERRGSKRSAGAY